MAKLRCIQNKSGLIFTAGKDYPASDANERQYSVLCDKGHERIISKEDLSFITQNDWGSWKPHVASRSAVIRAIFIVVED